MKEFLKTAIIILLYVALVIFQLAIVNNFSIFNITMNLFLILIVVTFMQFNINISIIFSFFIGLFLDTIYLTNGFGFYTFSYTLIGLVLYILVLKNIKGNYITLVYLIAISSAILEVISYGRLLIIYSVDLGLIRLLFGIILSIILNIAPAIALSYIIQKIKYGKRKISGLYIN